MAVIAISDVVVPNDDYVPFRPAEGQATSITTIINFALTSSVDEDQ